MSEFVFKSAQRSQARLRLALAAVSGGGKTMGALRVARGIVEHLIAMGLATQGLEGKICVIDTERNSAQLYADVVPFQHLGLTPPYSVDRYNQAIHAAEQAGFLVCIIDQITHAWAGPGGQLEWIDTLKAGAKNAMSPWSKVTPVQQDFYDRMLRSPMHIIATMRSKAEWVLEEVAMDNGRKKTVPRKIGMSPVQREGIEYEFTTCLDIDLDTHMATSTKDRTRLFDGRTVRLDEEVGKMLAAWLLEGTAAPLGEPVQSASSNEVATGTPPASSTEPPAGSPVERLESSVCDFELAILEIGTLPDLASLFDSAQKHVRSFVATLGAPTVKPFLERLVKAKDERKVALQGDTNNAGAAPTGGASSDAASGGHTSAHAAPAPDEDPDDAALSRLGDGPGSAAFITADDVAAIERACLELGLTLEEGHTACGVERFSLVKLAQYATAMDLLKLAAKQKAERAKPARRTRAKAAA